MKIPILMYHRIADRPSESRFTVSTTMFARQMRALADEGYSVIGLDSVTDALEGSANSSPKSVAITFDDGFLDTYEHAREILNERRFTATFFLVSGLMGNSNRWMEREGYPSAPLMQWSDAKQLLKDGFTLGSHTQTHPKLNSLAPPQVRDEIAGSKRDLEDRLGVPIRLFAYPYGLFNGDVYETVRSAGFRAACSTQSGFNTVTTDRFALRRIEVTGRDSTPTFLRSVCFGENHMSLVRQLGYYSRRFFYRTPFESKL